MTRRPKLSGKARQFGWGYLKIAAVEVDETIPEGGEPKMISERSLGVVKVHDCSSLYYGKGIKSEGALFLKECRQTAYNFNKL